MGQFLGNHPWQLDRSGAGKTFGFSPAGGRDGLGGPGGLVSRVPPGGERDPRLLRGVKLAGVGGWGESRGPSQSPTVGVMGT